MSLTWTSFACERTFILVNHIHDYYICEAHVMEENDMSWKKMEACSFPEETDQVLSCTLFGYLLCFVSRKKCLFECGE